MHSATRHVGLLLVLSFLGAACGGGSSDAEDLADRVEPYVEVCAETTCAKQSRECQAEAKQDCDACFDTCSSPFQSDPALCASICESICQSNCSECSAPRDQCATVGIRFDPPPINHEIEAESLGMMAECSPDLPPEPTVTFQARSLRHEFVQALRCDRAQHCATTPDCYAAFQISGTLGDLLCQRLGQCGSPCVESATAPTLRSHLNDLEAALRPELVAQAKRCAAESDCTIAAACWVALQPALGLSSYPAAR